MFILFYKRKKCQYIKKFLLNETSQKQKKAFINKMAIKRPLQNLLLKKIDSQQKFMIKKNKNNLIKP